MSANPRPRLVLASDSEMRRRIDAQRHYIRNLEERFERLAGHCHAIEDRLRVNAVTTKIKKARIEELVKENGRLRRELARRANTQEEP